jgi:hypothetical protein
LLVTIGFGIAWLPARTALAQGDFTDCFLNEADFGCYESHPDCVSWLPGYVSGEPPAIRLAANPFLDVHDPPERDLDGDYLRDDVELEIAAALAPYAVNAWAVHQYGGDPDLGEPTALFQVRPYVAGGAESISPARHAIRVRYALLWNWDDGYLSGDACGLGAGYTWHAGDDQGYEYVLEMVGSAPGESADSSLWRVRNSSAAA